MGENLFDWSVTAATNASADSSINWAEGQPAGTVNNSARSMMAVIAKWRTDICGSVSLGGSATSYTFTSSMAVSNTPFTGMRISAKANAANTSTATLNFTPNGGVAWGAKHIRVFDGSAGVETGLIANQIAQSGTYEFIYDTAANSAAGAWILLNPNVSVLPILTIASSNVAALAVGPNGATNPVLQINAAVAGSANGVIINGQAGGVGVGLGVSSISGSDHLFIDAKGSGTIVFAPNSTGSITFSRPATFSGTLTVAQTATFNGPFVVNNPIAFSTTYVSATLAVGGALTLTTTVARNVLTLSLDVGDWDVTGVGSFNMFGTVSQTQLSISQTSATMAASGTVGYASPPYASPAAALINVPHIPVGPVRVRLAATTTIFLVANATFSTTGTVFGQIVGRRISAV